MDVKNFDFLKDSIPQCDKEEYFEVQTLMKFIKSSYGNWTITSKFKHKGYNGNIYKVENNAGKNALLKLPRIRSIDNEKESKQNLIIEIESLKQVSGHPNIQSILDSDNNPDNPFFVYEEIPGCTLDEFAKNNLIDPRQAIQATINLLNTLKFCHSKNIVHRDIKPDNIICRNNKINDMVLIDFGLSTAVNTTYNNEHDRIVCNRSIALPELFAGTNKSDIRSDIAYVCCGVFFYMLFGFLPRILTDGQSYPFEQDAAINISNKWGPTMQSNVFNFLTKAFSLNINKRFQSIDEAKLALSNLEA